MEKSKFKKCFGKSLSGESVNRNTNSPICLFTYLPIHPFTICSIFLIFNFAFLLAGCGYTLQGRDTLPFTSVKIGRIENKTFEPKLEDKFQKALADELIRNGIMISNSAKHIINGTIDDLKLSPLAEKEGVASEYQVIIKARFFLTSPDGKVKELRNTGVFIVSFSGTGNIESLVAAKEQATETAMRNLASEIRAGIVYGM